MNLYHSTNIPTIPSWANIDSTKLMLLMKCPRDYFLTYILGLRHNEPNEHLTFGGAMADAQEQLALGMASPPDAYPYLSILNAREAFRTRYLQDYPDAENSLAPDISALKSLHRGLATIDDYALRYALDEFRVIDTETIAFTPIDDEGTEIITKTDTFIQYDRGPREGYWVKDDKTAGFANPRVMKQKRELWEAKWQRDFQMSGYDYMLHQHAAKKGIDPALVRGVIVNGILLYEKRTDYLRIDVFKDNAAREWWLGQAQYWNAFLRLNMELLAEATPSDRVLHSFSPATNACDHAFGCNHPNLCPLSNPLQHCEKWFGKEELPMGYKVDHWDPLREFEALPILQ